MAQHRARRKEHRLNKPNGATNSCGLVAFDSRREARFGAGFMPLDRSTTARPYQCKPIDGKPGCGLWHVGYLPTLVIQGVVTADEWFGRNGHEAMRKVIPPLLEHIEKTTRFGTASISRRTCPVTDVDLWTIVVDTPDAGQLVAQDYDSPAEAGAVALAKYRNIITGTIESALAPMLVAA